jgi:HlyD family secretion protein
MTTKRLEYQELELPGADLAPARRARWLWWPAALVLALVAYQLVRGDLWLRVAHARDWVGLGASATTTPDASPPEAAGGSLLTHLVEPMDLAITTIVSGTLESASSSPVYSEVAGVAAIIRLVPAGTSVAEGDVVVELDSSSFAKQLTDQQIVVEKAGNAKGQAQQARITSESKSQNDEASALLALEFARLDLQKHELGEYPVMRRQQQIEIALAEEELESARVELQFSEDLAKDKYINQGELKAARFGVTQAEFKLENARENLRLLEEYTYPRQKRALEAKVSEAERTLAAVKDLARIDAEQIATNLRVQERTLELEQSKLADLERQIKNCKLRAPKGGIVVYPVPRDEDAVELFIKQGNRIQESQHVFSIPDTEVLQISTLVHEARVNQIKPGMQARVRIESHSDVELNGEVIFVAPYPEDDSDWRRTNVKFYETKLKLLDQAEGLRPGMSAKVEILIDRCPGVLTLPVQSVVQKGRSGLCYVLAAAPVLRRVHIGRASNEYVEILEGLTAGERVVLAPDLLGISAAALQEAEKFQWSQPDPGLTAAQPEEQPQETEYEAVLLGPGGALGESQFEIAKTSTDTKYEFEVTISGGPPGATLEVSVAGVNIGSVTLDALGACEFEWSTKKGTFPANFPLDAGPGTPVTVGELSGELHK